MSLLTYQRYLAITGDTTSASATILDRISEAQELLEEELGRVGFLEDDGQDKTERLLIQADSALGFVVYPSAIPITDPGDYTQAGAVLAGASPDAVPSPFSSAGQWATVTYRGGYTPATVPASIERDLAWAAYHLARPSLVTSVPAGATSVRLGDAAVTYAQPAGGGMHGVSWSKPTLRHRKRRV